jgi:pantothenate kinase type III
MSDPLVDYLRTCCVHVLGDATGSGFFIAPKLVVTCSHVVGRKRKDGDGIILEKWDQTGGFSAPVAAIICKNFPDEDIAFIQTSIPSPAYAPLGGEGARRGHKLTGLGFPKYSSLGFPGEEEQYVFSQFDVDYEGETWQAQARALEKFKAGQVEEGYSGGPLLNLNTCRVMGVVRLTRGDRNDLGGWAVGIPVLLRLLRECGQEPPSTAPSWTDAEIRQRQDYSAGQIQLTPEQLRALLQNPGQSEKIEQLSLSLGENRYAIRLAIRSLGEAESQIPDEMLAQKLVESVKAFEHQLSIMAILSSDDSEIQDKYKRARLALESDNPAAADASLAAAAELGKARARTSAELKAKAREVEERGLKEAAEATAQRGQLAMARLAYLDAAVYFAEAADLLAGSLASQSLEYRQQQASALYQYGDEQGDNVVLEQAIETYKSLLQRCTRDLTPLDWARTQTNLGNTLRKLGERESGTDRLLEAVAAHRAALEEYRRERVPLLWATTQTNLGNALRKLGERESGTDRLLEAVTAYRAALEERRRERVPLDWAMTQNNLGVALETLGERESGTDRLVEAVAAYRAALEERRRERVPLDWAMTQNNLGVALETLGERESGTDRLLEAVTAYRAALEERRRERVPLDWAATQNNLGTALQTLGERESGTDRLVEAVAAYRAALEEHRRERVPLDWAMTQSNLGVALKTLGERESGSERLVEAVAAYRAALEEYRHERVPLLWATTQNNLGNALVKLGERESGTDRLLEAVTAYRAALEERRRERVPLDWATTQSNLGVALVKLGERNKDKSCLTQARAAIEQAFSIFREAGYQQYNESFAQRLHDLDQTLDSL